MTLPLSPLPTARTERNAASPGASITEAVKSSAVPTAAFAHDIRPDAQALARFKEALIHYAALNAWIRIEGSQAIGVLEHGRFESRFSPLLQISGISGVAYERIGWRANLLAYDRTAILVSSAAMFASIRQSDLLISLDRMTRAMHSINFFASQGSGLLFLPVHEGLLLNVRHDHGQYFAALLLSLRINPAKVVIEIPAVFATQTTLLARLVASYHRYGFKVAVNLAEGVDERTKRHALPSTSKPEFLLTESEVDAEATQITALSAEQADLTSLASFARDYGATLVARAIAS